MTILNLKKTLEVSKKGRKLLCAVFWKLCRRRNWSLRAISPFTVFKRLVLQTHENTSLFGKELNIYWKQNWLLLNPLPLCGVCGHAVEGRPRNHEVPSSSPVSGSQLWDFSLAHTFRREYWCSSQEAESREISIRCKNFFLNRCKINMFKLITTQCRILTH